MDKNVTVLTPNGRRQVVKVSPNTTLLQILEDVCTKHNFESDEYGLTHHNKEIGLTQMFRFSGLPNNCLLEMTKLEKRRVASTVEICVQMEDGSRQQSEFAAVDDLWQVVEKLYPKEATNFEHPVVIYMRTEIIGKERISKTTLKSLGITAGRAMIRFINKKPEELKTQASVYVAPVTSQQSKEEDVNIKKSRTNSSGGSGGFAVTKDLVASLKQNAVTSKAVAQSGDTPKSEAVSEKPKPKYDWGSGSGRSMRPEDDLALREATERAEKEKLEAYMENEPAINYIGDRNALLFSLDTIHKELEEYGDSFFELTVNDLKLILRDLRKEASGSENAPLLTEKLRQLEESKSMLNKISVYKNCIIRIQFPDRHVLQAVFKPIDTVKDVMIFVRKFLINEKAKFCLFSIPPKTILPLDKTLLELNCVPTALMHFGLEDENDTSKDYLKPEFLTKLTSAEGALYAARKLRIMKPRVVTPDEQTENNVTDYQSEQPSTSTDGMRSKNS
ncbi:tether containing UBX domain for GLUT4 [Teleopsis dalmanni]|uniref:tether containing UBX domain for GLUT4 n=1 Tax=Teleopsis dalmanni TaxID=139649 RepID=UPI0018CE5E7A|nr:tether containing UBX domain for GLUT4 [Teleopsis dalmanni]